MNKKPIKNHRNPLKSIIHWFNEEKNEAKKVSWPTLKETCKYFMTVCVFTFMMTMYYTFCDSIISLIIQILGGGL